MLGRFSQDLGSDCCSGTRVCVYMDGPFHHKEPQMTFLQIAYLLIAMSYIVATVALYAGH